MEVIRDAVGDDGVAGVIAAGRAADHLRGVGEDVDKFAFAFVAPLGAEDERYWHDEEGTGR